MQPFLRFVKEKSSESKSICYGALYFYGESHYSLDLYSTSSAGIEFSSLSFIGHALGGAVKRVEMIDRKFITVLIVIRLI
jgi:hypothetical protein